MSEDWPPADDLAAFRANAERRGVTVAMAEAAHRVLSDYFEVSWYARVNDYVSPGMTGADRTAALAALRTEDERLYEQACTIVAGAIAAALAQRDD